MGEQKQSEGREKNDAIPVEEWPSKGVAGQKDQAERTGRTEQVTGQARTFKDGEASTPSPDDLTGPAGDPAEGKPSEPNWPA